MIRNNHFKIVLLSILVITQIYCKKGWLDIKTDKSLAVPSSLKDFQALLDNAAIMNVNTPGLTEIASDGHHITETLWGKTYFKDNERTAYIWTKTGPNLNVPDWNNAYQIVFYCNNVLDGLKKIDPGTSSDQKDWDNVKGQALFFRAINFYDLAQTYAQPYLASSASNDLGIPLRLEADVNIATKRSTVKQTYDQIINDLLVAKDLLPDIPLYKTRPSKPAVLALIARTYLIMQDYPNALMFAESCLKINNTLIDYNILDSTSSLPLGPSDGDVNKETLFLNMKQAYFSLRASLGGGYIDSSLYLLYDNDDLRKSIFFTVKSDSNITFRGNYTDQTSAQFSGLGTDEVYLIRAECYARAGNTNAAMTDLNTLLQSRWRNTVAYPTFSAINPDDALHQILNERKKELLFRGLRWSDLRRLNTDNAFKVTIMRTVGGNTYTLEPNSYQYTLPIPDDIIQATGIQQNPGW